MAGLRRPTTRRRVQVGWLNPRSCQGRDDGLSLGWLRRARAGETSAVEEASSPPSNALRSVSVTTLPCQGPTRPAKRHFPQFRRQHTSVRQSAVGRAPALEPCPQTHLWPINPRRRHTPCYTGVATGVRQNRRAGQNPPGDRAELSSCARVVHSPPSPS